MLAMDRGGPETSGVDSTLIQIIVCSLLGGKLLCELLLDRLNAGHVRLHAGRIPTGFEDVMTAATYEKSVDYTLAKARVSLWSTPYDLIVLLAVLFSGVLPWAREGFSSALGTSVWADAAFLILTVIGLSFASLPWDYYDQFKLEARFGFNKSTVRLWVTDRLKGILLSFLLGVPLLALLLSCVGWGGGQWWLMGWLTVVGFQFVMMIIAPMWILPLFNKLEPLPEGELRDRLLELGKNTGFSASTILVMDGSKRSAHSNAFFTGFGRFRKIVLFDTLIEQLSPEELEGVLAHEIGHYKKRHVLKMMLWSTLTLLLGFWVLSVLLNSAAFFAAFGFREGTDPAVGFLLFGLLSGAVTFWVTPLSSAWSRTFEYEADAYAAAAIRGSGPLISALKKLTEKNLSNLTPHPWYSRFYYSHPTLVERSEALSKR